MHLTQISAADDFEAVKLAMDSSLESASKYCSNCSTRQLQEVVKLSHQLVSSPLHHLIEAILYQRKEPITRKFSQYSKNVDSRPSSPTGLMSKMSKNCV